MPPLRLSGAEFLSPFPPLHNGSDALLVILLGFLARTHKVGLGEECVFSGSGSGLLDRLEFSKLAFGRPTTKFGSCRGRLQTQIIE